VCCSVLQCVAVCPSVSQCVAVCCSVLQCVAVCCSVLQCVAVCCSALQCVAVCCSALQCITVRCSALQCVAVRCSVWSARAMQTCTASQESRRDQYKLKHDTCSVLRCVVITSHESLRATSPFPNRQCVPVCCSVLHWIYKPAQHRESLGATSQYPNSQSCSVRMRHATALTLTRRLQQKG